MFPREFHWTMLALNSASVVSNMRSLKCVLDTFNIDVTLFRVLSLDGIFSLVFSLASAITHGAAGMGFLQGRLKCSLVLMTTMPPYINGILCSLMISVIRFLSLTSQSPQYWMTSNRITQITTGMVYFTFVYGIGATICNALLEWNIFPTYTVCLVEAVVEKELDNSIVLAFFVMPSLLMAYTTPIIDLVTFRLMKFWSNQSRQIPKDCRDIPFRATLISAFLWIFIFILGLSFSVSTTEISTTYKAMAAYICAAITTLLRHPCVSAFSFRANAESRRLDLTEERERRRNTVIQEAKKERESRKILKTSPEATVDDNESQIQHV